MRRRLLPHMMMIAAVLAITLPVRAGGMATVHLDDPPTGVIAGVPWSFGLMVMQHDVTPVNVDEVTIDAQHRETGETLRATARQEGVVGHYVAELTFPAAGSWKWSITPVPFAGTSFESIVVRDKAAAGTEAVTAGHPVQIRSGSCAQLGEIAHPLSDLGPASAVKDGAAIATTGSVGSGVGETVTISQTTIDLTIAELLSSPHAIAINGSADTTDTSVGCGDISGQMWEGELIVGLVRTDGAGAAGIATLSEIDEQTTITLYVVAAADQATIAESGPIAHVDISENQGGWAFTPGRLEVAAGTTVVWTNNTETSHTVTGSDLAFEDSGPFGKGESYRQMFTAPGTYSYFCSPHPYMTGTIVVT